MRPPAFRGRRRAGRGLARPLLVLAITLALPGFAFAEPDPEPGYRITNVVDDFLVYHAKCRKADPDTRVAEWDALLERKHPKIFRHFIYRNKEGQALAVYKRDCIRRFWADVAPRIGKIAETNRTVGARIREVVSGFRRHFPDFEPDTDFCVTISLSFRGKVVRIDDRNVMAIGLEEIAAEGPQLPITIAHELFHLHHFRSFSPSGGLYRALWTEGLATYASGVVVPGHRLSTVLGFPGSKVDRCHELLSRLAADLRRHMGERNERLFRIYFGAEANDTEVPPEAGYYVGYLIVEKLAKETPLAELVRWDKDKVFRVVAEELKKLE